jgi:uncharacterized protein
VTHLLLAAVLLLLPSLAHAQQLPQREESTVTTAGEGMVQAVPDRAWVSITAESRAGNPREAQRRNAEAMTPVLDKLRAAGIPGDAIRTTSYDLQQEWDFVNGRRVSRGYVARNSVDVRVDAIDRVGELLEIAVSSGATSVGGVRFDVKDLAKLEREALRLAVADARAKAETMVEAAGRTIQRILRIEESGTPSRPMPVMAMAREAAASDAPPIAVGQMEIRAQVTLTAVIQ